jgi:hypothetical protein
MHVIDGLGDSSMTIEGQSRSGGHRLQRSATVTQL